MLTTKGFGLMHGRQKQVNEAVTRVLPKKYKDSDLVVVYDEKGELLGHMWYSTVKDIWRSRVPNFTLEYSKFNGPDNVKQYNAIMADKKLNESKATNEVKTGPLAVSRSYQVRFLKVEDEYSQLLELITAKKGDTVESVKNKVANQYKNKSSDIYIYSEK